MNPKGHRNTAAYRTVRKDGASALSRLGARNHPASAFVATVTLIAFLATLFGGPVRVAYAVESAEPADTPNFSDTTNGVRAGGEVASATQRSTKARKTPVSARGSFTHSLAIQVPPGRLGMTPSLALGYDSANLAESPVGAGWSFDTGRISRGARLGYPAVAGLDHARVYDASRELFTSPDGELVATADGPTGVLRSFAPVRETSPVRYEFVSAQDRWVDHEPNGVKKYYGADPFDARAMRVVTELGTFSWLILREEDPHGNFIKYDYHNASSQSRTDRLTAQLTPILARVEWGGNRLTGQASRFAVSTILEDQPGPLNVLEGNTLLSHRIRRIEVAIDGAIHWSYTLGYSTSADTGKSLLRTFSRDVPAETTTFSYTPGAPMGERFEPMGELHAGADDRFYTEGSNWYGGPFNFERSSFENAVQAPGHRGGVKFVDIDGDGTTDAIYHAAGIGTTSTHILWEESRLQQPSATGLGDWTAPALGDRNVPSTQPTTGLPYFPLGGRFSRNDFADAALRDLVDVDGDGDLDGISLPLALYPRNGRGVAARLPPAHYPPLNSPGEMPIKIHTNSARAGDVVHLDVSVPWPSGITVASNIYATQANPSAFPPPPLVHKVEPRSDVNLPAVDLNGDGKTDFVLLKHRANMLAWSAGGAFAVPKIPLLQAYAAAPNPPLGKLIYGDLEADVARYVRDDHAFVFVAEDLLDTKTRPEGYVLAFMRAADAGFPELEPDAPVMMLSGQLGGIPIPGRPEMPSMPIPIPGGLPGGGFEIPRPIKEKPWWFPVLDPEGDVYLPIREKDWFGRGGQSSGAAVFFGDFHYVPRVYLMRGGATRSLAAEGAENTSNFERSLQVHLNNGYPDECLSAKCQYPSHVNFNTFFADLNGDGLPDLVKAPEPIRFVDGAGPIVQCLDGHEVYLNRGYTFEETQNSLASFGFGVGNAANHPLRLVANRDRSCAMVRPRMQDSVLGAFFDAPRFPLGAMAQADVNADGRLDLVLAYQHKPDVVGSVEQRVFLNTGRGFQEARGFGLPAEIAIARNILFPSEATAGTPNPTNRLWPRDGLTDTARLVDLDGDGLVDIVSAGFCFRKNSKTTWCDPARWYRNKGNFPDRLERIDEHSGAWTTVEYAGPKSGIVTVPEGGLRPPPSARFVSKVRSAPGPETVPAGYDPFPVEEVRVSYENYVRDVVSNEHIGFERVREEFVNSFRGEPLESVFVTQTFDVRAEVADSSGNVAAVRHPLKGAQVSLVSESGHWTSTEIREYRVEALGGGVRIRPSRVLTGESGSSGVARWAADEYREPDAYGNPTFTVSGNFNGVEIGRGPERRTTVTDYENRTDARWQIGLVTGQRHVGYSEDADGSAYAERLLAQSSTEYDARGSVAMSARLNVTGPRCDGPADDVTTYEYWPNGLVKVAHEPNGRNVTTTYDRSNLYPARVETRVGKMVGGAFVPGATVLARTFATDPRTGKRARQMEPDGSVELLSFDARGRLLTRTLCPAGTGCVLTRGPSGIITVESNEYTDTFPVRVTSTLRTDTNATYQRSTYLDGAGRVLAIVEGESTGDKSLKERTRYDAFGRAVESYLPSFVPTFEDGAKAASGPQVATLFDGFDRPRVVRRADGTMTSYEYEPRITSETNPRGVITKRTYDTFGALAVVERNPGGRPSETSTHTVVRDGLGAVVRVVDGDGSTRRFERDAGGRIRYLTLPADASTTPAKFSLCHDVDDKLVRLETPAGRVVTTLYDELGRPLVTEGTDAQGLLLQNIQTYDEPVPGGLGRLTTKSDESGVYKTTYDGYGRPESVRFDPSARAKADATNVGSSYTVTFRYSPTGQLKGAIIAGLPSAAELRYTRDARGRVIQVESKQGSTWTTIADAPTFDPDDRLTSAQFGNLTKGEWDYGELTERLDAITYTTSAGDVLASVGYRYDENGNPKLEERHRQGTSGVHSQKVHEYDRLDRLAWSEVQSPAGNRRETYTFSPGGNLLTAGGDVYAYTSPVTTQAASQVSNAATGTSRSLSYEPDGFLQTDRKVEGGATETRSLAFDPFGCIRSISKEATGAEPGSATSEYTCGLDGRVVARATTKPDGSRSRRIDVAGIGEIRPDEGVFVIRVPVAGSVNVEDARLLSDGTRAASLSGYLVNDARGSVLATTAWDSDTVITREAEYDAWGQKLGGYSALTSPRHGFGGAEADAAAGTYTFGARTYDPTLRRWVSPDPLLAALPNLDLHVGDSLNLYGYADGNPVKHVDKSGYWIGLVVVAVLGAIALGRTLGSDDAQRQRELHPEAAKDPVKGLLLSVDMMGGVTSLAGAGAALGTAGGTTPAAGPKAERTAPGSQATKAGAEGTAKKVETTAAQKVADKGCFVAGSPIATESGLQPIETLQPGDRIWTRDEVTGEVSLGRVAQTFERREIPTLDVTIEDELGEREQIRTTAEHPFWVERHGWITAEALAPGDPLVVRPGGPSWHVASVRSTQSRETVYNLEVDDTHSYFVGAHEVWVHNVAPECAAAGQGAKAPSATDKPAAAGGGTLLKPGPHAGDSVPTTTPRVTSAQKAELTKIGQETGCHSCGTKEFGTRSGKPVGDHQPPTALTQPGQEQRLYPQCATCSAKQGAEVRKELVK